MIEAASVTLPAGAVQVQDGLLKAPIRGIRLHADPSAAKPVAMPAGRTATVVGQDKEKTEHKVVDLMPLYRVGATQRRAAVLMFQKIGQMDVAKIETLKPGEVTASSCDSVSADVEKRGRYEYDEATGAGKFVDAARGD